MSGQGRIRISLNGEAREILKRGGGDNVDDDMMLMFETLAAMEKAGKMWVWLDELQEILICMREDYGEDARDALRKGYVRFGWESGDK